MDGYRNTPAQVAHGSNNSPKDLITIASTNGGIGIGLYEKFVGGINPINVANCIRTTVDYLDSNGMNGIDHVGLGSDFDGAVETTVDAAHLAAMTGALAEVRFCNDDNRDEINKIMGGNMARAIRASIPAY